MLNANQTYTTYENGWLLRIRPPQDPANARLLLLIHGWTGNEDVMWVFARDIPADYAIIAPRGSIKAPDGYGWVDVQGMERGSFAQYTQTGEQLLGQVGRWAAALGMPSAPEINLMGFSQGAAMSYTILLNHPERIGKTAGLSGFLPSGYQNAVRPGLLTGKQVFVAHGSKDETVPLAQAKEVVEALERAGASVSYCEEGVGHKLGAACFNGLRSYFS